MEEKKEEKKSTPSSMFDTMPPKFAFWAGVVTATAIISVLGFALMVGLVLKGVDLGESSSNKTSRKTTTNTNSGTTTKTTTGSAKALGTVDIDSLRNVRGEGNLTVVEYSDLECPFCKRFHPTMQQVVKEYDGKVQWAYKHFPLASLHPKAAREAEATECAAKQDKFWDYTDAIFERTPSNNKLEDSELFVAAADVGLDVDAFTECLESGETSDIVTTDLAEAQALGGTGTPFSVIIDENGEVLATIPGALPIETMRTQLDQLLN